MPAAAPGFDPAGDARALVLAGTASPAPLPIPGTQLLGSLGPGQRFVLRVPTAWNGKLVVAGTPAVRSEFASDAIWSDYVLARGYAFAASNKCIPFNGYLDDAANVPPRLAYRLPFEIPGVDLRGKALRFGALEPHTVGIAQQFADYVATIETVKALLAERYGEPCRTYAVGLSMGGAQVRWLLESHPALADGGVEWASVFWSPESNLLTQLPGFLRLMPRYVASNFSDRQAHDAVVALGFPPDRLQSDPRHPSLWLEHYSNVLPFYTDVSTFLYARLIDPETPEHFELDERAAYVPSPSARRTIEGFAHRGALRKPLIGVAGEADTFVTPHVHA
ncbi:MAG TPA: hypothetical protein VKG44_05655, partial [Candidatus Baltobacteraceae bacterium]|nr:hypothetical protein [Candidatus Baltobacteraceae bacterium]